MRHFHRNSYISQTIYTLMRWYRMWFEKVYCAKLQWKHFFHIYRSRDVQVTWHCTVCLDRGGDLTTTLHQMLPALDASGDLEPCGANTQDFYFCWMHWMHQFSTEQVARDEKLGAEKKWSIRFIFKIKITFDGLLYFTTTPTVATVHTTDHKLPEICLINY